ncbi:MAG: hypothetical protein KBT03_08045 [Bacteroidales bacterium]|nr:hypothetical protein [Candidatus Scybalousia scybalohippi]
MLNGDNTTCDICPYLYECKQNGNVANIALPESEKEHYIIGICVICKVMQMVIDNKGGDEK